MKIIKNFKNKSLYTFTKNNKIKIYIDDNYDRMSIKKGYKINLINSNKGSYKGSFMNNYICKKFISNQKVNITNIEINQILNYCKYFLLSQNEYINYFPKNNKYQYQWLLRFHVCAQWIGRLHDGFVFVNYHGNTYWSNNASYSLGFIPFFYKKEG